MKTDLKQQIKTYTARHGVFSIVRVPPLNYLVIDGQEIRTPRRGTKMLSLRSTPSPTR